MLISASKYVIKFVLNSLKFLYRLKIIGGNKTM